VPEDDVRTTLGELERKLEDLEAELRSVPRRVAGNGASHHPAASAPEAAPHVAVPPAHGGASPFAAALASSPGPFAPPPVAPASAPPPSTAPASAPPPSTAPASAPPPSTAPASAPPPSAAPASAPPPSTAPASAPPPSAAPVPTPAPPQPAALPPLPATAAFAPAGDVQSQLLELERFRGELELSTRTLLDEYDRLVAGFRAVADAVSAPAAAPAPPSDLPADPTFPPAPKYPPAADPQAPTAAPAPASSTHDPNMVPVDRAALGEELLEGTVALDAGPFRDIATLSSLEQAVGSVPGVRDVQVRSFEGSRAYIDVLLDRPVELVAELRRSAPVAFTVTDSPPGRLRLEIDPGS